MINKFDYEKLFTEQGILFLAAYFFEITFKCHKCKVNYWQNNFN